MDIIVLGELLTQMVLAEKIPTMARRLFEQ